MPDDIYDFVDERYARKPDRLFLSPPTNKEGESGEIRMVKEPNGNFLYMKVNDIWYRFVDTTSNRVVLDTEIHTKGLRLTKPAWIDQYTPSSAINSSGAGTPPDWSTNYGGFLFDDVVDEDLLIIVNIPHQWKYGTDIYPHIHWMPMNTNTGNVKWTLEYRWTKEGEAESSSWTALTAKIVAAGGTVRELYNTKFDSISGSGFTSHSVLTFRLIREASDTTNDTFNTDVLLKGFGIYLQIDGFGSEEKESKNLHEEIRNKGVI